MKNINFVVDRKADKKKIKDAFEKTFEVKVEKINMEITMKGEKKAYIKLKPEYKAADVAVKLGIIDPNYEKTQVGYLIKSINGLNNIPENEIPEKIYEMLVRAHKYTKHLAKVARRNREEISCMMEEYFDISTTLSQEQERISIFPLLLTVSDGRYVIKLV